MNDSMKKRLSLVVSVYNEEEALEQFFQEADRILRKVFWDYELIFVNDGSQDRSLEILNHLAEADEHVKIVSFSKNFDSPNDHFYKKVEKFYTFDYDSVKKSYEKAKEFTEAHGIKIYNATRGGKLEVFERVDFDTLG